MITSTTQPHSLRRRGAPRRYSAKSGTVNAPDRRIGPATSATTAT